MGGKTIILNKKIMMMAILLVSLLAVSAVSAADNATSDIDSADETNYELVSVEENQLILKESAIPEGTFTDLANEITNATGELNLTRNYSYSENDYSYKNGININKSIVINGNGYTINGNDGARIFSVPNSDVVLKDIIFANGKTDSSGGVICVSDGECSAVNCTFINNYAWQGGAIYHDPYYKEGRFYALNCTFENNIASGPLGNGGAIYGGSAENCTFINNSVLVGNGGAMYRGSAVNCTFMSNSAHLGGGAIYSGSAENCTFINNTAKDGGAVSGGSAVSSTFINNTAEDGGAMFNSSALNCTFINNSAGCSGAIGFGSAVNCTFTNNSADNGGAMCEGSAVNCTFDGNSAVSGGGAIDFGSAVNCTFIGNSVKESGGAIDFGSAVNCTFVGNSALGYGGAIYYSDAENCIFQDNYADIGGAMSGGISLNSTFRRNHADNDGGAVCDVVAKDCSFESNFAKNGGAMSKSVALNCTFNNNNATDYGGAVYNSKVTTDSEFSNNNAPNGKDTYDVTWLEKKENTKSFADLNLLINGNSNETDIYLNDNYTFDFDSDLEFMGGITVNRQLTVHGNGFTIDGWGIASIFKVESSDQPIFKDIILVNGKNDNWGGAINGMCTAVNCTFIGNSALYGGAMCEGSAVNCTFINNTANWYCGAMEYGSAVNCTFIGNSAVHGGAMGYGSAVNCTFVGNSAESCGAMYRGSAVNCTFVGNSALYGGAMCDGSAVNCTFVNNSANAFDGEFGYGGAVAYGSAVNCTFINNTAKNYGGALYECSYADCIFEGNTARRGNDIYPTNGTAVLIVENFTSEYNSGEKLIINLTDEGIPITDANITIEIYENNSLIGTYYCLSGDGWVVNLNPGNYSALVLFNGDDDYAPVNTTANVIVNKVGTTLTAKYDNATKNIVATVKDSNGNPVSGVSVGFDVDGVKYVTTDANGQAEYSTSELSDKKYNVSVMAYGNEIYKDSNKETVTVDLSKISTALTASDVTMVYNGGKSLVATLKDADGKVIVGAKVTVKLGDVTKNLTTDKNGQVSLSLNDIVPNNYTATITFDGDSIYVASSASAKVTINKQQAKVYLRNALYFVLQTKMVKVTLWDGDNKPLAGKTVSITLNENGWRYSGVTDENGNAYIRVGVGFGVHSATVTFDGDENYTSNSKTGAVRVIKETPSLMLPGAYTRFKASDPVKTVKIYLLDRNSKPLSAGSTVTIKINGHTYVGHIDDSGIARINININTRGIYKAEFRYAGNSAYNEVTRTTKIEIK